MKHMQIQGTPENFGFNTDPLFVRAGQDGVAVPRGLAGVESAADEPARINFRSDKPYKTPAEQSRWTAAAAELRSTLDAQIDSKSTRANCSQHRRDQLQALTTRAMVRLHIGRPCGTRSD
jgi:hypothetical protein